MDDVACADKSRGAHWAHAISLLFFSFFFMFFPPTFVAFYLYLNNSDVSLKFMPLFLSLGSIMKIFV